MNITNEINKNFELLGGNQKDVAHSSLLSGLFSINFGENFLETENNESLTEFVFNEDEIKFIDYISTIAPEIKDQNKDFTNFDDLKIKIKFDNTINPETKDNILKFLDQGNKHTPKFNINIPQDNLIKVKNNSSVGQFIKKTNSQVSLSLDENKLAFNQGANKLDDNITKSQNKFESLELKKPLVFDDQPVINNKSNFVKKIKKNDHPNKIYQLTKTNTLKFDAFKDLTSEMKMKILENTTSVSSQNLAVLETVRKNINEIKSNNNQYLNQNTINQNTNAGQNFSQNNDSSFSSNAYNSVLENFLDHLDLSQKGWTDKLVSRIEKALVNGGEEIEFNLKPKNLGVLKVSVSQKNGMSTVKIITENSFVTSALAQNENYLQKLFNDQGMSLDFTAQNDNHSFNSKSNFDQGTNNKEKNLSFQADEDFKNKNDENDEAVYDNDSSRHIINVIA